MVFVYKHPWNDDMVVIARDHTRPDLTYVGRIEMMSCSEDLKDLFPGGDQETVHRISNFRKYLESLRDLYKIRSESIDGLLDNKALGGEGPRPVDIFPILEVLAKYD